MYTVCSIWPIDSSLSGVTTLSQSGRGRSGNEGVLQIRKISLAGALPSEGLISYPGHLLEVGVLSLCRDAVGVFYSLSLLYLEILETICIQVICIKNLLLEAMIITTIESEYLKPVNQLQ